MTLHIERTLVAPRGKVFRAWTDLEAIKKWFVYRADVHWGRDPSLRLAVGGTFCWRLISDDNQTVAFEFHGTYLDVTPPEKLAFTWEWQFLPIAGIAGPGMTVVTVEFQEAPAGTHAVLTHSGLASEAAREAHAKGWNRCLDGIAWLLERAES